MTTGEKRKLITKIQNKDTKLHKCYDLGKKILLYDYCINFLAWIILIKLRKIQ